jgi:hypothetical protein
LYECRNTSLAFRIVWRQTTQQEADPPDALSLLRLRRQRPRRRYSSEQSYEVAPFHGPHSSRGTGYHIVKSGLCCASQQKSGADGSSS